MKLVYSILFLLVCSSYSAQSIYRYEGQIIDAETKKGIPNVHVFTADSLESGNGTVSNINGYFILKSQGRLKELIASHLSYQLTEYFPASDTEENIVITMNMLSQDLNEVVVYDFSAQEVMSEAIENLAENHEVEPVYYSFYTRITYYSDSSLHFLEEHSGYIHQKVNHSTLFHLEKSRMKGFTKIGDSINSKHHMVSMTEKKTDNLGKYKEDFLQKRKFRNYAYKFGEDQILLGRNCYVIHYNSIKGKPVKKGTVYIDKKNFGILKKINESGLFKEISFIPINGKYYLHFTRYLKRSRALQKERITVYNTTVIPDDIQFLPSASVSPKRASKFIGDFEDDYWENINYVPLDDWILKQIK